jgi:hypothetical protein
MSIVLVLLKSRFWLIIDQYKELKSLLIAKEYANKSTKLHILFPPSGQKTTQKKATTIMGSHGRSKDAYGIDE